MYVEHIEIRKVKSIGALIVPLSSSVERLAGWHVFIGDNGAGKSSFIRSVAIALMGPTEAASLRENWGDWLQEGENEAEIKVSVTRDKQFDTISQSGKGPQSTIPCSLIIHKSNGHANTVKLEDLNPGRKNHPIRYLWSGSSGWFSAGFGPYRRFRGGDKDKEKIFYSNPRAAAHISAFGEDAALTEIEDWFQKLHLERLEDNDRLPSGQALETYSPAARTLAGIKAFLNHGALLPHGAYFERVDSKGVFFRDGHSHLIALNELSDGFRAILALTLELIRQMILTYGLEKVFPQHFGENPIIDLPGVVLIDEIDAHLHPTWQVRIGQWFTQYFPQIQFIVTTHSPLICRAAEQGSVWRLAAPGSNESSRQITGTELQRLIYGNVLDAYGTEVFGENITSSDRATEIRQKLAELTKKSMKGVISAEESDELQQLKSILPTGG